MSTKPKDEKIIARMDGFLQELNELTRRHKIKIGGCGCCGSPWLEDCSTELPGEYILDEPVEHSSGIIYRNDLGWKKSDDA
jgi:hypothetical protein